MTDAPHRPVMLDEVLALLAPQPGKTYLDGTFGAGGYSRAILGAADCRVIGLDRDPSVAPYAAQLAQDFPGRFELRQGCFGDMASLVAEPVDGIVLDIGVSSMQLDQAERGFSFQSDGPLDMRMSGEGPSAADVVNGYDEAALADVIYRYGEERASRRIARRLVLARAEAPITRTRQLRDLIASVVPGEKGRDPATRSFQGLRIHVNDELGELERGLAAAEALLPAGGRLVVVVFHSLEDRIVKDFLQARAKAKPAASRHLPAMAEAAEALTFRLLTKKAMAASAAEAARNPRARSAKLRAAIRTEHSRKAA